MFSYRQQYTLQKYKFMILYLIEYISTIIFYFTYKLSRALRRLYASNNKSHARWAFVDP